MLVPIIERARKEGAGNAEANSIDAYNRGFRNGQQSAAMGEITGYATGFTAATLDARERVDNAQADAIKAFRPEIERLERMLDTYKFIVECHESTIREKNEQLAGAHLLSDFLRNQGSETTKKLDEAKEIISLASRGYTLRYPKVPGCLCTQCEFPARVAKFLEAA